MKRPPGGQLRLGRKRFKSRLEESNLKETNLVILQFIEEKSCSLKFCEESRPIFCDIEYFEMFLNFHNFC